MCPLSKTSFPEWQAEQNQIPEFVAASHQLEPGYQISRLRIQRGLAQTQLAAMVGIHQPSNARLENGSSVPSLSFLDRIATALDAKIELHIIPNI